MIFPKKIFSLLLILSLSSCSVAMALKGSDLDKKGRKIEDFESLRIDYSKKFVEEKIGPADEIETRDGKKIYKYYIYSDKKSVDRAMGHMLMTASTFGIWELVGTPYESNNAKKYLYEISYDKDNKIEKYHLKEI